MGHQFPEQLWRAFLCLYGTQGVNRRILRDSAGSLRVTYRVGYLGGRAAQVAKLRVMIDLGLMFRIAARRLLRIAQLAKGGCVIQVYCSVTIGLALAIGASACGARVDDAEPTSGNAASGGAAAGGTASAGGGCSQVPGTDATTAALAAAGISPITPDEVVGLQTGSCAGEDPTNILTDGGIISCGYEVPLLPAGSGSLWEPCASVYIVVTIDSGQTYVVGKSAADCQVVVYTKERQNLKPNCAQRRALCLNRLQPKAYNYMCDAPHVRSLTNHALTIQSIRHCASDTPHITSH